MAFGDCVNQFFTPMMEMGVIIPTMTLILQQCEEHVLVATSLQGFARLENVGSKVALGWRYTQLDEDMVLIARELPTKTRFQNTTKAISISALLQRVRIGDVVLQFKIGFNLSHPLLKIMLDLYNTSVFS